MATAAQRRANRANSTHSTGPRTPEGKAASSTNSTRHGLTSAQPVLPGESQADYDRLLESLTNRYRPEGEIQLDILNTMAAVAWKLRRLTRIEHCIMAIGLEEFGPTDDADRAMTLVYLKNAAELERLRRYQGRLERQYTKCVRTLEQQQLEELARIGFVSRHSPAAAVAAPPAPPPPAEPAPPPVPKTAPVPPQETSAAPTTAERSITEIGMAFLNRLRAGEFD